MKPLLVKSCFQMALLNNKLGNASNGETVTFLKEESGVEAATLGEVRPLYAK